MAGSINSVTILGNLGGDPEVRALPNGGKVATLSVATSESWVDKSSGEKKEKVDWHRVVIFGNGDSGGAAGVAEKYLKKGSKVAVVGKLETKKWTDDKGVDRWTTEIIVKGFGHQLVLLDGRDGSGARQPAPPDDYGATRSSGGSSGGPAPSGGFDDDTIPF